MKFTPGWFLDRFFIKQPRVRRFVTRLLEGDSDRRIDVFGTTLTDEFLVLARHWDYDAGGIQRIALNAVDAAFLPDDELAKMRASFAAEFAALRQELGLPPVVA